jgi:hypothetical protein
MSIAGGKVGTSGPMGDIEFNYSDNVDVAVINNGKGSPTVRFYTLPCSALLLGFFVVLLVGLAGASLLQCCPWLLKVVFTNDF